MRRGRPSRGCALGPTKTSRTAQAINLREAEKRQQEEEAIVVALILLAGVCYLVAKEKAGKPLFTNLDGPDSKA